MNVVDGVRISGVGRAALLALVALASLGSAVFASQARAANEVAAADFDLAAQSGQLYSNALKPANFRIEVKVTAPFPASPSVLPLKNVKVTLPTDLTFVPKASMPECGSDKVGPPPVNMSVPPQEIIARCPKSVVGNGTADLYLAKVNYADGPNLRDSVLVVFNGGTTNTGRPKIKIYGYSKGTGAGIYMEGVLTADGGLDVDIPVLPYDSAVGRFDLNIPGPNPIVYDKNPVPESVGLDKTYAQAKCSAGSWKVDAALTLGERDTSGAPTGPNSTVVAPTVTKDCVGTKANLKAKLAKPKVKGPAKAKRGKKVAYKVTVKNTGGAAAKGVKIVAKGKGAKGAAKVGKIAPGKSRTVKVKVKFTKKGKSKVTFTAKSSNGGSAKGKKVVRVK